MTEAQVWRDRYFKLRDLIQHVSASRLVDKGVLLLRLTGAARVKHQAQADEARELLHAMLLRGAIAFQERDPGPNEPQLEITGSVFIVADRRALMELVREAGERNLTIGAEAEVAGHG